MTLLPRRTLFAWGLAAGTGLALTACSSGDPGGSSGAATGSPGAPAPSAAGGTGAELAHVHGVARDPADGTVLLATHGGLLRLLDGEAVRTGPDVDLMGFTVAADGAYLASGHPAEGTGLPEPLGLAESRDGGRTWTVLSRGGRSDFHALAAGPRGVVAFDGTLRASPDGTTWEERSIPAVPHVLAVSPGTGTVLATTERGLLRSEDDGVTWTVLDTPQLMSHVAWADDRTVVGAGVDGRLLTSEDGGRSWHASPEPLGRAAALSASRTGAGAVETLLVVGSAVLRTVDGGSSSETLL
ncbi:F510_1955 family glycosylhydrolase [Kocuria sp. M1R5S2]|uniref:F510_1955 family glycosylhydrolase n=1 Tax=Kocuria rhizosphaerae TaxID=3376285 RepID=UPI00378C05B3